MPKSVTSKRKDVLRTSVVRKPVIPQFCQSTVTQSCSFTPAQFRNSTIPQSHNSTTPQFCNSTIPKFRSPAIPHIRNSAIPQFHNSANPQYCNSAIPQFSQFHNSAIPQLHSSAPTQSRNSVFPHICNSAILLCRSSIPQLHSSAVFRFGGSGRKEIRRFSLIPFSKAATIAPQANALVIFLKEIGNFFRDFFPRHPLKRKDVELQLHSFPSQRVLRKRNIENPP